MKVRAKKSSLKLGSWKKLEARYHGPFDILSRIGHVVYDLALLTNIKARIITLLIEI